MRRRLLWSGGRSLLAVMLASVFLIAADWVGRSEQQIKQSKAGRSRSVHHLLMPLLLKISMLHQLF